MVLVLKSMVLVLKGSENPANLSYIPRILTSFFHLKILKDNLPALRFGGNYITVPNTQVAI